MIDRPSYFEPIRQRASARWDQLEKDPELAGPWHQLFKQVQSPRHVLSELLQNADDAGATEAEVEIIDGCFVFIHNGEDFTEEHFGSLCRFGYSNKRALHTIGFRGIGFKSTFSLGNIVELASPSLSIAFARHRFTEPRWTDRWRASDGRTSVRVRIEDVHRQREIEKNLTEWLASPVSLLFFKHIRQIRIGEARVHWENRGPGPVSNSEWMALNGDTSASYLIVRSPEEEFPDEALLEIRNERLLGEDQDMAFPPCRVEIVLGAKGRLYVVLPTGVETELPFASNAPFIQDPARLKVKDPETSPTNRWLLHRIGNLAAGSMLQWLRSKGESPESRARAYAFMPDVDREVGSLEGVCATIAEESFARAIESQALLLAETSELQSAGGCVVLPAALLDVWPARVAAQLFDCYGRPPLSRHVTDLDRRKLESWGAIEVIEKASILKSLQASNPPRPKSWGRLFDLWSYVAPDLIQRWQSTTRNQIRIVPVQGRDVLYSASEVARLGEKRLLQSEEDWNFLSEHLLVLNQNWGRFLAEQRREQGESSAAVELLRGMGLTEASDISTTIDRVASSFFCSADRPAADCARLTQICAKLGAKVSDNFRYMTHDGKLKAPGNGIFLDKDGSLSLLFEDQWQQSHFLHPAYNREFSSCTRDEWQQWLTSDRAGLERFPRPTKQRYPYYNRQQFEDAARERVRYWVPRYKYQPYEYHINDWDFESARWSHWEALARETPNVWSTLGDLILSLPLSAWGPTIAAGASEIAKNGSVRSVTSDPLVPRWILRLRDLPCLRDSRGMYRKPFELLRRTASTESLMDVEPFVHAELDTEANRQILELLGVRNTPTGPSHLLTRLRALAKAPKPLIPEIEKWYRRLDLMVSSGSTDTFETIRRAFAEEPLVLTEEGVWTTSAGVFLHGDEEELPDTPLIRVSVRDLTLWQKVGVALRPSEDLAIQWLKALPSGAVLAQDDARRVRSYLARHASRIWHECEHWLNLAGEWVPKDSLTYSLSMQSLIPWKHLHEGIRRKTADFQKLGSDILGMPPFDSPTPLARVVEERFSGIAPCAGVREARPWLTRIGYELQRIELEDDAEQDRIRQLGRALAATIYQTTQGLEVIAYIDGTPAGLPRAVEAVWMDSVLYVENRPLSKLARSVAQELARAFNRQDVGDAIKFCFDRQPAFVTEYMEENFRLGPPPEAQASFDQNDPADGTPSAGVEVEQPEQTQRGTTADDEAWEGTHDGPIGTEDSASDEADVHATENTGHTEPSHRPRGQNKPPKPSLMERFANARGFRPNGDGRFHHPDGGWIAKSEGTAFPWVRHSANGELLKYYWPKEHCLQREPLQLEADAWSLLDTSPETYALILANPQDRPEEYSGARLREMLDQKRISLYPATYRLILDHDHE